MYAIAATAFLLSVIMVPAVSAACDANTTVVCAGVLATAMNATAPTTEDICTFLTAYKTCLEVTACGGTLDDASKALIEASMTSATNATCPGLLDSGANLPSAMSPLVVVATVFLILLFHFPG